VQGDPVYTLYTLYTERIQGERACEEEIRKTGVLSLRIPRISKNLYNLLPDSDKEIVKAIAEAAVIAMAMKRYGDLPCKDILERRVAFALGNGPTVSFNVNVNYTVNKVEARAEANVNIDLKELDEIRRLLDDLLSLVTSAITDERSKRVLRARVLRAHRILDKLAHN